jgi:hypothetical protein
VNLTRLALALVAATGLATATPALVFWSLDVFGAPPVEVGLDVLDSVDAGLDALRARSRTDPGDARWDVAYLGDSMVVAYPEKRRVPLQLQLALERLTGAPGRVRVDSLAAPGMSPFDYYFLADRIAAAGPDQVILPVNLAAFSKPFLASFARPELAAYLPPGSIPEALTLPLFEIGLTADRLLVQVAVVELGGERLWRRLVSQQARLDRTLRLLANEIGRRFAGNADERFVGLVLERLARAQEIPDTRRFNAETMRERYGAALDGIPPGNPNLRLLHAAIRQLRAGGAEVLVYASPMNVEHLERLGIATPAGLARTLASIDEVAQSAGASFLDLHALLRDDGFRDGAGHLTADEGPVDGPRELAERLAPAVLEAEQAAALLRGRRQRPGG